MPFPAALSGGDLTTIRGGARSFTRYLIIPTSTIMLQFAPSVNASGSSNAQIIYTTADSGAAANVLRGMTVIVSPSTDPIADLKNKPEECLITYARLPATSTTLDIGETNYQWTTGDTVTVWDDWRIQERKTRIFGSSILKDYNLVYAPPIPRIYAFYADVVTASGSTVSYSPTPQAEAMASGVSIFSWAWQVIEGGALTHTSTSQNPTFTLDTGVNWLHLTVEDDNGNTAYAAVMVAVVPDDYSSVVHKALIGTVNNDLNNGTAADITVNSSVSTWLPGQMAMVVTRAVYTDATDNLNIDMLGWITEARNRLEGDDRFGIRQTFSAQLAGVATFLEGISIPALPASEVASPDTWGEFAVLSVYKAIWYLLSMHVANIPAIELPSDHANYRFPDFTIVSGSIKSALETLAMKASGALMNWSPNGEIQFDVSLLYETTAATRDAATVYATYTTLDGALYEVSRPPANQYAFGAILLGAAVYNTTNSTPRIYQSQAPGGFVPGVLREELDGLIMTKDLSDANARIEAGKLSSNHFFASNASIEIRLQLIGGYREMVASGFQWHKVSLSTSDLLDGMSFDTNTRFICTRMSSRYNADEGSLLVDATLREETDGGSNYSPDTLYIPISSQQTLPTYPTGPGFPNLSDFDPSDTYGDGFDDTRGGWVDEDDVEDQPPHPDAIEVLHVPFKGGSITSQTTLASGTTYQLRITNDARISASGELDSFSVDANNSSYTNGSVNTVNGAQYLVTVVGDVRFGTPNRRADCAWVSEDGTFTDRTSGSPADFGSGEVTADDTTYNPAHSYVFTRAGDGAVVQLKFSDTPGQYSDNSGSWAVAVDTIPKRGDAFYQSYNTGAAVAFTSTKGLTVDTAAPTKPDFNSAHEYIITVAGGDATIALQWNDPDSDVTDNENAFLRVEIVPIP